MDAERVLKLFDWFWFEQDIIEKQPNFSSSSSSEANPNCENDVNASEGVLYPTPVLRKRSMSENLSFEIAISRSGSLSPNSVLSISKLQSIFSGIPDLENSKQTELKAIKKMKVHKTRRRSRCEWKSLSELEYEELKGFMDLGYVFSEEDRNSSLASIIPGLHRLGKKDSEEEEEEVVDESKISRPYLSEAWEVVERKENPLLMDWKLPCLSNEIDVKENLRWWAHTVASTVI